MSQTPFRVPAMLKRPSDGADSSSSSKKRRMLADSPAQVTTLCDTDDDADDSVVYAGRGPAPSTSDNRATSVDAGDRSQSFKPVKRFGSNTTLPAITNRTQGGDQDAGFYVCTWRKPQKKKNKSWDSDAILIIYNGGASCSLKCINTGTMLASKVKYPGDSVHAELGVEMRIGSLDIEIQYAISREAYVSGEYDSAVSAPKASSRQMAAPARQPFKQPTFTKSLQHGATAVNQTNIVALTKTTSASRTLSSSSSESERPSSTRVAKTASTGPLEDARRSAMRKQAQVSDASASSFYAKRSENPTATGTSPSVSPEKIRRTGLGNPGKTTSKAPESRFPADAPGAIVMPRPNKLHQRVENKKCYPVVDVVLDPIIAAKLRPHQVEGIKFLYECVMGMRGMDEKNSPGDFGRGGILADSMGLGKTLQAIVLIQTLLTQTAYYKPAGSMVQKVLVVCPLSLIGNWKREFNRWTGRHSSVGVVCVDGTKNASDITHFTRSKNCHVLVIGYEKLRSCIGALKDCHPPIGLIVCDEGHRLKSKDAKTTKMFEELHTPNRIILSGTPVQNDLSELYAMVDFVSPGLLGPYPTFKKIFEDPIVRSREHNCTAKAREVGKARSEQLLKVTKRVVLRRGPEVLEAYLLPKCELVLFCSPSAEQLALYSAVLDSGLVRQIVNGDAGISPLVLIDKLRKLCNAPSLLLDHLIAKKAKGDEVAYKLHRQLKEICPQDRMRPGDPSTSGKLVVLAELLKSVRASTDDKFVIVSNFTATLDIIQQICQRAGYKFVRLDGSTPQKDRTDIVTTFNRATQDVSFVCLLSAKAGGVGLNLIGANRLVLFDSDWNPSTDKQAMARIHRDGQKKPCFIYRMLLTGTMDEKIYQRQISKIGLSDALIDDDTGSSKDAFSAEELRDIFRLHTDTKCLTHDHLGCSCDGAGIPVGTDQALADEDEDEDEDDLKTISFKPASQLPVAKEPSDRRAKLAALFDWAHLDCTQPDHLGTLPDPVLLGMLKRQLRTHPNAFSTASAVRAKGQPSSDSLLDVVDEISILDSDAEMEEAEERAVQKAKRAQDRLALAQQLEGENTDAMTTAEQRARAKTISKAVADGSSDFGDAASLGARDKAPASSVSLPSSPGLLPEPDDSEGKLLPSRSQWSVHDAQPSSILYIYSKQADKGKGEGSEKPGPLGHNKGKGKAV